MPETTIANTLNLLNGSEPGNRWKILTQDQLQGADYALRVLRTSPVVRGRELDILDGLLFDIREESCRRLKDD